MLSFAYNIFAYSLLSCQLTLLQLKKKLPCISKSISPIDYYNAIMSAKWTGHCPEKSLIHHNILCIFRGPNNQEVNQEVVLQCASASKCLMLWKAVFLTRVGMVFTLCCPNLAKCHQGSSPGLRPLSLKAVHEVWRFIIRAFCQKAPSARKLYRIRWLIRRHLCNR